MVAQLIIEPAAQPLRGSIPVPGDQDVALARLGLAALSRGKSTLAFRGEQRSIRTFLQFLGVVGVPGHYAEGVIEVEGAGLAGFRATEAALDLRGDADVAGLAMGLLVSRPFASELLVDDVVAELLVPVLRESHRIEEEHEHGGGRRLLLHECPESERPPGLSVVLHGVFPWVKRALLLAGLRAAGPTVVEERFASADHLERAMTRARMPIDVQGTVATLHPPRDDDAVAPQIFDDVGSASFASALLAAALVSPSAEITLREVGTNPTRGDFFSVLRVMGAELAVAPLGDRQGEPFGNVSVRSSPLRAVPLRAVQLGGETAVRLRDDLLPLLALAARAKGASTFTDLVTGQRGADPKIWGRAAGLLTSAGVQVERTETGMTVVGTNGLPFQGIQMTTGGDSRLAVLATLLALGAKEKSVIDDVDCLALDFPRWFGSLRALGARLEVVEA